MGIECQRDGPRAFWRGGGGGWGMTCLIKKITNGIMQLKTVARRQRHKQRRMGVT